MSKSDKPKVQTTEKTKPTQKKTPEKPVTRPVSSVGVPVTSVVNKPVGSTAPKLQKPDVSDKSADDEKPKIDYASIIKPHSYVYHKKFGKGYVTTLNVKGGFLWVRFMDGENKGEKKFDFPGSFENGFLSQSPM